MGIHMYVMSEQYPEFKCISKSRVLLNCNSCHNFYGPYSDEYDVFHIYYIIFNTGACDVTCSTICQLDLILSNYNLVCKL
jgi:hypothetical protein